MNRVEINGMAMLYASVRKTEDGDVDYAHIHIDETHLDRLLGEALCRGMAPDDEGRIEASGMVQMHIVVEPVASLGVRVDKPTRGEAKPDDK